MRRYKLYDSDGRSERIAALSAACGTRTAARQTPCTASRYNRHNRATYTCATPYQCFTLGISDKVAHLVLNHPAALNTMQPVMWRELTGILQMLQRDTPARALVISSTGKHFTAGMALDVFGADAGISLNDGSAGGRASIAPEFDDLPSLKSFADGDYDLK